MTKIEIVSGDITRLQVDVIVNAANSSLLGGGGVDGAIHRSAGSELFSACKLLNGCNAGEAKITPGFRLPSPYVIHTVGPVWKGGGNDENQTLASCYQKSLRLASENNLRTIAFPNISTGIYGFPKSLAAKIALETVRDYLANHIEIERVLFCCFDEENLALYKGAVSELVLFEKVVSEQDIILTSKLASIIWNEHYVPMIGQEQVDYMLSNLQSPEAIEKLINKEGYQYYIIYHHSEPSGYISIRQKGNDLFLSKFYLIREKRRTGLGREGMRFISLQARMLGLQRIFLTVNINNLNSIKAYKKLGFQIDSPVITQIGAGYIMDDYNMSLQLL